MFPGAVGLIVAVPGVTAIDIKGFVTVRTAVPEIVPNVAVIVDIPATVPVANPPPVMLAPVEAVHVTLVVMFLVLPSL